VSEKEPFTGPASIDRALEKGADPNADLNEVDKSATKAEAAVTLAMSGASYTSIKNMLGYSSAYRARAAVERVLASASDSAEGREHMRELNRRRYNRLLQSVMGKAVDPADPEHLPYNARALAIVDRIGKLYGLDAPTQIQITPTDEQIQQHIAYIRTIAGKENAAAEADIFDMGEVMTEEDTKDGE
jgi:hypothetical protein